MLQDLYLFAPPATPGAAILAGIFGLLIGSFLNVVIYRLPVMWKREYENYVASEAQKPQPHTDRFDLMVPRSSCPHCGHKITALENIPVVSWLALRGKCSQCKTPISARYPMVEACTGLLSALFIWRFGSGWMGLATLVFLYLLIALTMIDYDEKVLPDDLNQPLLWAGLLVNINGMFVPLRDAVIAAAAGYLILWAVAKLYSLFRKEEGMGMGDFKLLAALGAWMGWMALPNIILLSSVVGAVIGISLILFAGRDRKNPIPFGPYLAGAGVIVLLYEDQVSTLVQLVIPRL